MSTRPIAVSTGMGAIWKRLRSINPNIPTIPTYDEALVQIEERTKEAESRQWNEQVKHRAEYRRRTALGGSYIPERYQSATFDNYEIYGGQSQQRALEFARNWVDDFLGNKCPKGFIFTGDTGTGKNHLAAAMCMGLIDKGVQAKLVSVTSLDHDRRAICFGNDSEMSERDFIKELAKVELFILDEVGVSTNTPSQMVFIDQLIQRRADNGLPTGIISNMAIEDLAKHLGMRIMDRISEGSGAVINFSWGSYRKRGVE